MHVLIAHAGAQLAHLGNIAAIGSKARDIIFLHARLRGGDDDAGDAVVVFPAGESFLCSHLQLPHPDGIGKHGLGGIQPAGIVTGRADGGIVGHGADFRGCGIGAVFRAIIVYVDVNAQFLADGAIIIQVGAQVVGDLIPDHVLGGRRELVNQRTVLKYIVIDHRLYVVGQVTAPFHLATQEVVVGNLPVHTGISVQGAAEIFIQERALVLKEPVGAIGLSPESLLLQIAFLARGVAGIVKPREDIHPARTIVHVEGAVRIVALGPAQGLRIRSVQIETKAVALAPDRLDPHHRPHRGIVLGSGVRYDFNALDLIALQAIQLRGVRHAASVDINHRRAFADHFQAVLSFDEAGSLGQHIFGAACVFQDRAPNVGLQALAGQFGLGHDGLDGGALQHGGIVAEGDDSAIDRHHIHCLVAQHGYHHDAIVLFCHDIESAVFSGDHTAHDGRIGL